MPVSDRQAPSPAAACRLKRADRPVKDKQAPIRSLWANANHHISTPKLTVLWVPSALIASRAHRTSCPYCAIGTGGQDVRDSSDDAISAAGPT